MTTLALPLAIVRSRRWVIALGIGALAAAISTSGYWLWERSHAGQAAAVIDGPFYSVKPVDLDVEVVKDGEIQAVNNIDIACKVEGQTTITTLVKEGAWVKKGDVLITLDGSAIKQRIEDTTLDLEKAESDVTAAREMKEIQASQNSANIEQAEVSLELAKIDLKQYEEGSYPQQVDNAQTDLEMAQLAMKDKEEDLSQSKALQSKGFVTAADVKRSELDVTTARSNVDRADTALKVLTQYTHQMDLASKKNALSQAEQQMVRTQRENAANLMQKVADLQAKEGALATLKHRMDHLQEQFDDCTITAPAEGLVVYASSFDRSAQTPIEEGAQVREYQTLLRLPDTSVMKAVVRVQESQVSSLKVGQRATVHIVGIPEALGATLSNVSVLADNSQRWWNPDLKEYPVDLVLDRTPKGLKPGMGASSAILVDHAQRVLAVPLATLYSAGADTYVFQRDGTGVRPAKVKVGRTNETQAELVGGLNPGQDVLMLEVGQGAELLANAGIHVDGADQAVAQEPPAVPTASPNGNHSGGHGGPAGGPPTVAGAGHNAAPHAPGGAGGAAALSRNGARQASAGQSVQVHPSHD